MQLMLYPVVSVIIPVYNVEKYLACCLDSVVGQTYQKLDIILVNDGSTDKSGEICRQYKQKDMRIRLFEQENRGLSAARNVGIDNMRGDYIVFVDSDDYIAPCMIEILLEKIQEYNVPIAVCDFLTVAEENNNTRWDVVPEGKINLGKRMSRDEVFDCMGKGKFLRFLVSWGKIYDKKIFEKIRFAVGKIYEDEFIFHKIYRQIEEIYYINLRLCAYRQSTESLTRKNGITHHCFTDFLLEARLERLSFFQEYGNPKYVRVTVKLLFREYIYHLDWLDKQKLKERANELEKNIYRITGKRILWFRFFMVKYFPEKYQLLRKYYLEFKQYSGFFKGNGLNGKGSIPDKKFS